MFNKKDKSAKPAAAGADAAEPTETPANEPAPEADDAPEPEETPAAEPEEAPEASMKDVISQINACTEKIEDQAAIIAGLADSNKTLSAKLKELSGDRTAEIDQAASKKSVQQTSSQGVPADEIPEAEGEGSMDEPKTIAEFQTELNGIEDPKARGAYYQKYNSKFFG